MTVPCLTMFCLFADAFALIVLNLSIKVNALKAVSLRTFTYCLKIGSLKLKCRGMQSSRHIISSLDLASLAIWCLLLPGAVRVSSY